MARTHCIRPLTDPAARARWRALWETSPQRSPFSSLGYADAISSVFPLRCELHLVSMGDVDEAGALVFWKKRGPYRIAVVPPFTPHSGLLLRETPSESETNQRTSPFESLLEGMEHRFQLIRLQLHPSLNDVRPATWRGWAARPYYTYQCSPGDEMTSTQSKRVRNLVRSEQSHYSVEESPEAVPEVVRLFAGSLARQRHPLPAPPSEVARLIESLLQNRLLRLFTATRKDDNAPTAGVAVLSEGPTGYYWVAGSEPGPAMSVLLANILPTLASSGMCTFDYVGANTPSIAEFKRRMGARLTPYFGIEKCTRPELLALERLRTLYPHH